MELLLRPILGIILMGLVVCPANSSRKRRNAPSYYNDNNARMDSISPNDEQKLINLYGKDKYAYHKDQFLQVANLRGAHQESVKRLPKPIPISPEYLHEEMNKVHLESLTDENPGQDHPQQHERAELTKISQPIVNKMIRNLLVRLEMLESNPLAEAPTTTLSDRCSLQGLWVSTVKGVAIHLEPQNENLLRLKVVDMPSHSKTRAYDSEFGPPFVTSDWIGSAHLSSEIPTTISIILQEKWTEGQKMPKTAVFVGQCLICNGFTAIQGTWTVFPESPVCFKDSSKNPQIDLMYLL